MNMGGSPAGSLRYKLKFTADPTAAAAPPQVQLPTANSVSDTHSRSSSAQALDLYRSPKAKDDDDPTLASVSSKVSLAKQAMQALTAELAELTGAHPSSDGLSPTAAGGMSAALPNSNSAGPLGSHHQQQQQHRERVPQHSSSMREQSHQAAGSRQYFHQQSMPASYGHNAHGNDVLAATGAAGEGRSSAARKAMAGGSRLSSEDLLAMYGGSSAGQLSGAGLGPQGDLVLQLQQALQAAHCEKVTAMRASASYR
jgi:hypothetical protein